MDQPNLSFVTNEEYNFITFPAQESQKISFYAGLKVVLVLDKDGMEYMGKRIEDAGEAHAAFLATMYGMQNAKFS